MVAVKLEGRLGNQLFQYAFIYAAAKKLNTSFYLDKSIENFIPGKYFTTQRDFLSPLDTLVFSIKGYKNLFTIHSKKAFYKILERLLFNNRKIIIDSKENPSEALSKIKNDCIFEGYFQSEQYFFNLQDDIKTLFTIKDTYKQEFKTVFTLLPKAAKYVTIHIRRTDYISLNIALDTEYYHKAIKSIHNEGNYYIFISDDINFVKNEFDYLKNKYVSEHNEITDLQFLMSADVCILSNSTFSWWGAWLNNKQNKTIYAPKYFLGWQQKKESPVNIYPNNWIQIDV